MLVLSRKAQEEIIVPQCDLTITILEIRGGNVRIGITAPPDLKVYRQEVLARMEREAPVADE